MENFTFRLVSTTVLILVLCSSLRRAEVVKLEIPITKENLETINKIRENEDVDGQKSEPTVLTVQVDVSKITEAIDDRFAKLEEKMDSVKKEIKKEIKKECACQNGTEPFTTMVETVFVGGTAGASSEWSQRYAAEYAFLNKPPKKSGGGWTSGRDIPPPNSVWYDFKRRLRPAKISFLPRSTSVGNANAVRVRRFQFIGTDDANCSKHSNWKVLCQAENPSYKSLNDERGCTVTDKKNMQGYHCLGLRSLLRGTGSGEVGLRGIRMWIYQ